MKPSARELGAMLLPAMALVSPAHAHDFLSVAQAQTLLFPGAVLAQQPLALSEAQRDKIQSISGLRQRWDVQKVWRADVAGKLQGWFFVDEVIGKHEFITYAVAVSPDGHVMGLEILSYRETHGSQVRDAAWRRVFNGKTLNDRFKLDQDVPNITGATLSCRNVMDGVKRLLAIHKLYLSNA